MEEKELKIWKPTHVVTDIIWVGEITWKPGTELQKNGFKMYDLQGRWISAWFIKNKIKEIER